MKKKNQERRIIIIAGPNGAGKTTFVQKFLLSQTGTPEFINAGMIARGLSPFAPAKVSLEASKVMLREIHRKVDLGESLVFETTLSGLNYSRHIPTWQKMGYHVRIVFLTLPSADAAIGRVRIRMAQGGHGVPESVIRRRFELGKRNFDEVYRGLVDSWAVYDNSGESPILRNKKP